MKKKLFVLLAMIVVLSLVAIPVLARTNRPRQPDGVWCYTPVPDEFFTVGDYDGEKAFLKTVETGDWTGIFEGTSTDYGVVIFPDAVNPPTSFAATVVFDEVEVDGATGFVEMDVAGIRPDPFGDWDGEWIITSASGELEGLQGHGDWWGPGWLGNPEECGVIYYSAKRIGIRR
ncbi:MAG: hypothetical protein GY943_03275 [Chloroflexi bacterium]|nr:hypothetical protein [Chloroflexota bacterium]